MGYSTVLADSIFIVFLDLFKKIRLTANMTGNMVATSNPVFRLPPAISEILPTRVGLTVAPKSPANARNANMAVPPLGHFCADILIDPGHIMPTAKPQRAQPASPRIGNVDSEANK